MADSRLVPPDVSARVALEARDAFRAAEAETKRLAARMNEQERAHRRSPPPSGRSAIRAVVTPRK